MTFSYVANRITQASNGFVNDVFTYKSNGQIDTIVSSYYNNTSKVIKHVLYASNNKIAAVNCYSNNQFSTSTTYTYDSSNRVTSILITNGVTKYIYNYSYNSSGNQTYYEELYSFNGKQNWTRSVAATTFDDKPNPFLTLKDFEYFFSKDYQSEYDRLGLPATLSKNNPLSAIGTAGTTTSSAGAITYNMKYDSNDYVTQLDYHSLVQGSLGFTLGFTYTKQQ